MSSEAENPAARALFNARTSSSSRRTVVEIKRAIRSPYIMGVGLATNRLALDESELAAMIRERAHELAQVRRDGGREGSPEEDRAQAEGEIDPFVEVTPS